MLVGMRYTSPVLILLAACAGAGTKPAGPGPARYLYVWAGMGHDSTPGVDLMTVLDADPSSSGYGTVLAALTVDSSGLMPHHTEFVLPAKGPLFANDYTGDKSFLVDFSTPETPRFAGRLPVVPGGRRLHSFLRLANGHVLASVQFGDSGVAGSPGGLAEFDAQGKLLRTGWSRDSAFPGARIRTYALAAVESADRIVTTSAPMDNERTANVVQVWRLSDLTLLKTLPVPEIPGDSAHTDPFEVRALADGSVMMNSYYCGFFHVTDLAGDPRIERVMALPFPQNFGCSVPAIVSRFMIMPIAYAHRYATIDLADPAHPREVASFPTDSTFFPHWASTDPGSDRVVFTDQGDGAPMVKVAHFDGATGRLSWDSTFKDKGAVAPGVSYHRDTWPNGLKGMAMPHGAVFVP
ncbi:MAG TPA: hypothetical protein VFU23_00485 [Gemmatimonadales bacterium]|nr:hypothetical protein [Gemmatimonadales bacterium]